MSYEESFPVTITRAEVIHEVMKHYVDAAEFFDEFGTHETYKSSDLLAWLGY